MPKDFAEVARREENYSDYVPKKRQIDPNFILNPAVWKEIEKKHNFMIVGNIVGTNVLSLITAPLTTIQVSLQLSVLAHKDKYGDTREAEDRKALIKRQTEITVQERRKYELLVKSGVTEGNKPFRAPVYGSYREVIKALSNQGLLGFYKGNLIGMIHFTLNSYLKFKAFDTDFSKFKFFQYPSIFMLIVTGASTAIDIVLHPVQTMQSRFILQNRLPNFTLYKSMSHFIKKHYRRFGEMYRGWTAHLPKNLLLSFGYINLFDKNPGLSHFFANIMAMTAAYPLTTVIRRLQCQSELPGMIPLRYGGSWHTLKLMMYEEGVRGVYRGYTACLAATCVTWLFRLSLLSRAEQSFSSSFE